MSSRRTGSVMLIVPYRQSVAVMDSSDSTTIVCLGRYGGSRLTQFGRDVDDVGILE